MAIDAQGTVSTSWDGYDRVGGSPPAALATTHPAEVAAVLELVKRIVGAVRDDRQRIEAELATARIRPVERWRRRWLTHPVGGTIGRRLVWVVHHSGTMTDVLPTADGQLLDIAGQTVDPSPDAQVSLWHPVERAAAEVAGWRDRVVAAGIVQPIAQVLRDTYLASPGQLQDGRFADRPLGYRQLRALLRSRGWAGAALGPWDQGDTGSVERAIVPDRWIAELDLIAVGRARPDETVTMVRSGAVRILRADRPNRIPERLDQVPPRVLSEVLRDVALFTSVADPTRRTTRQRAADQPASTVERRAAALQRALPALPFGARLAVVGRYLRVDADRDSYLISLLDGSAVSVTDERPIQLPVADQATDGIWAAGADDPVIEALLSLASWLIAGEPSSSADG